MGDAREGSLGGIYFRDEGDGQPVVLIHGATMDLRMWRRTIAPLRGRFRFVALDGRGYGKSAMPDGPFRHFEDAAAVVDQLALEHAIVVGHSVGALYALELALARPDRVAGLVLACASAIGKLPFPDDLVALRMRLRDLARRGAAGMAEAKALWAASAGPSLRRDPAVSAEYDQILADYSGWYWRNEAPAQNLVPPVSERLAEIAVPTVVLDAALDHPYNRAVARLLADEIRGATRIELPTAGHLAPMEEPAAVVRAIETVARSAA